MCQWEGWTMSISMIINKGISLTENVMVCKFGTKSGWMMDLQGQQNYSVVGIKCVRLFSVMSICVTSGTGNIIVCLVQNQIVDMGQYVSWCVLMPLIHLWNSYSVFIAKSDIGVMAGVSALVSICFTPITDNIIVFSVSNVPDFVCDYGYMPDSTDWLKNITLFGYVHNTLLQSQTLFICVQYKLCQM